MIKSLRRHLTVILVALALATWLLAMIITALFAQGLIFQQIDRQLEHYMDMTQYTAREILNNREIASYFWSRSESLQTDEQLTRVVGFGSRGKEQGTNLWFRKRQVLLGEYTPSFPEPEKEGVVSERLGEGPESSVWRVLYRYDREAHMWLAVGVNMRYAENFGTVTFWRVLLPLLVIVPFGAAILMWGVGRGLRPLRVLAADIADRDPEALKPINLAGVPSEIRPVVNALNDLLARLQRALDSEHRFTSNAAHELQTPLAAIRAEVQRCQRQVSDEQARDMLDRIATRVSRATDTVQQLLTLARLDPDQDVTFEKVDINRLLIDVIAELGVIAVERSIEVQLEGVDEPAYIVGNAEWLNILLRNLLLNALSNSPSPGVVSISLERDDERLWLAIANDCDPIPAEEFDRLTDRFYRPAGSSQKGLGLGLSIALRIAELHGAGLSLDSWRNDQGFKATLRFDAA